MQLALTMSHTIHKTLPMVQSFFNNMPLHASRNGMLLIRV